MGQLHRQGGRFRREQGRDAMGFKLYSDKRTATMLAGRMTKAKGEQYEARDVRGGWIVVPVNLVSVVIDKQVEIEPAPIHEDELITTDSLNEYAKKLLLDAMGNYAPDPGSFGHTQQKMKLSNSAFAKSVQTAMNETYAGYKFFVDYDMGKQCYLIAMEGEGGKTVSMEIPNKTMEMFYSTKDVMGLFEPVGIPPKVPIVYGTVKLFGMELGVEDAVEAYYASKPKVMAPTKPSYKKTLKAPKKDPKPKKPWDSPYGPGDYKGNKW